MAAAEARAAWQRTANRCFVHEDAKRAPKLACSSSLPSSAKPYETPPTNDATTMPDFPTSNDSTFNRTPCHPNLSPDSKWWLQLQPNYKHQMDLMEINLQSTEDVDQYPHVISSFDEKLGSVCYQSSGEEEILGSFEVLKKFDDISFDSGSSWVGEDKNTPWWHTADTDELALAVARMSRDLLENCDLPIPHNTHLKKNPKHNGEMKTLLPVKMLPEDQMLSQNKDLSYRHSQKRKLETQEETRKAQLLDALCHSQTRARKAEEAAKRASAEKDHVVKLLFRQASEIFAYKQLLQLLQMENMYLQFRNSKKQSASSLFSESRCATPKTRKSQTKSSRRKWDKRDHPRYDVGRYAIVFAFGLGIIGAGLLFGCMLPIW